MTKPPILFTPEDFFQFCDCQLWKDLYDREHFPDVCERFNIAANAQAKFETWYLANVYVPNSKSEMKRLIAQTGAHNPKAFRGNNSTPEDKELEAKLEKAREIIHDEFCSSELHHPFCREMEQDGSGGAEARKALEEICE